MSNKEAAPRTPETLPWRRRLRKKLVGTPETCSTRRVRVNSGTGLDLRSGSQWGLLGRRGEQPIDWIVCWSRRHRQRERARPFARALSGIMATTQPVVLVVLDGWGYRPEREGNAIALAQTPTWDALIGRYPHTLLHASGRAVGLPEGQMGNSEVGHLNLGAGRVVVQDLVRIGEAIRDRTFFDNPAFVAACDGAKMRGATVHLVGLIGSGGVHAIDKHLFALIDLCAARGVPRIAIHALLDGRDTMPHSGLGYMRELLERANGRADVASLGGRYFGMDRDKRWDRTAKWYRAAVQG